MLVARERGTDTEAVMSSLLPSICLRYSLLQLPGELAAEGSQLPFTQTFCQFLINCKPVKSIYCK